MTMYSYSRVGCFETCPRQYKFRYIEKPKIDKPTGIEAFMGTMVHETLEKCYQLVQFNKVLKLDELLEIYENNWSEKFPENIKIVKKDLTSDDYREVGRKALELYHKRYAPFDQELILGLERRVEIKLDDEGLYKMQGYIDRITRDDHGRLRIHDYKTSARLPSQEDVDKESQLALYQIAVDKMWPDNNGVELVWHFVKFDTALISNRNGGQLDDLKKDYITKICKIENAVEAGNFPTKETNLCDWCDYFELCPAKGGKEVESQQISLEMPGKEEQVELVDTYIKLYRQWKDTEKRLGSVKEILLMLGEPGSSKLLPGGGNEGVLVSLSKKNKLPTKTSDNAAFEKVKKVVEDSGEYLDYSSINTLMLQKAYAEGKLSQALTEGLKPYFDIKTMKSIRIKKL